ncbi:hypothetical protein VNI00_007515 [Paramarasmius palmivorus]|uniref:Uncharacterized protein n=1 Tax=Paramarasmius palmivorus TaxID=297713 RepID=A0AAW0D3R8_9AGAR
MPVFAAPASSFPFVVPKTPPRKRPRSPSQSPLARSGNLFTPNGLFTPKRNRGGLDLGSPLFSPSPARSVRAGNSLLQSLQANKSDEDDDALSRELDSALDEMEMAVTSVPGTSSELADDSANNVEFVPASDADEYYPQKQIWPGLPPSSPPLPSSPMQSDEQLPPIETPYDEEPLATSDTEPEDDFLSPNRNDDDPTLSNSDMEDHTTMNSEGLQGLDQSDQQAAEDIATFLSQFTNLSSDAPTGVDTADTADIWSQMFQDPSQTNTGQILGGEDANAFWNEQLKHIISGSSTSEPADTGGTCDWLPSGDTGGLDIGKVMADIKDLYSGTVM